MFTGLIRAIGTVERLEQKGDTRIEIATDLDLSDIETGASIACSGCCLTVVEKEANRFAVEVSGETLSRSALGNWESGTEINLEPSLRLGDELGGHLVFGHVDGLAELVSVTPDGDSWRLKLRAPEGHEHLVAPKGSVALDGISLTINEVEENGVFGVNIIPHTWQATTLRNRRAGDSLNFEADMLARYVARMMEK